MSLNPPRRLRHPLDTHLKWPIVFKTIEITETFLSVAHLIRYGYDRPL
jgi:hypothetical protein